MRVSARSLQFQSTETSATLSVFLPCNRTSPALPKLSPMLALILPTPLADPVLIFVAPDRNWIEPPSKAVDAVCEKRDRLPPTLLSLDPGAPGASRV